MTDTAKQKIAVAPLLQDKPLVEHVEIIKHNAKTRERKNSSLSLHMRLQEELVKEDNAEAYQSLLSPEHLESLKSH